MPNYDAGHYFLTMLAPVRLDSMVIDGQSHSRRHLIREALAAIPTGERTVVSQGRQIDAPFARNTRTHFARFVVLDDVVFNGRVPGDTLLDAVRSKNLLAPQPVDRLSTPFLIFVADFDADSDAAGELRSFVAELWATMQDELVDVCQHCVGFDAVKTSDDFARYVTRCQIETTMPFNDYWSAPPALPALDFKPYLIGAAVLTILAIIAAWLSSSGWLLVAVIPGVALVVFLAYRKIIDMGRVPFPRSAPPAPAADLPTVLKALYLQRAFVDLAIATQGVSDEALYAAFGAFVADAKPTDIRAPTQRPGVIGV